MIIQYNRELRPKTQVIFQASGGGRLDVFHPTSATMDGCRWRGTRPTLYLPGTLAVSSLTQEGPCGANEHVFPCRGVEKRERASGLSDVFLGAETSYVLFISLLGVWDWVLLVWAIRVVWCGVVCRSLVLGIFEAAW